ncbi:MAG: cytochrome d ubiquinol oxidase subunit II [Hyphomicrobiaceae bacterium]|nr:cytochrome d ubiquinol oxidase subunit II [Hyphomicrobiaceae bacterium]
MGIDLAFLWAAIIAFAVLAYVVLDGFDLGIGILFPLLGEKQARDDAMNSVAPVWDGNETWLVLGGGGLLAVFPLAYAIVLPALYAPIIAMLIGLVLRGVAFEFRWRTERGRFIWDWAFFFGSTVAALAQGIALGALVQGIRVEGRAYAGGWYDWLTPFSMATGIALLVGYALLGATWLIMKTEGDVQRRARRFAQPLAFALVAGILVFSVWTPFLEAKYMQRWFSFPSMLYAAPIPILTALAAWRLIASVREAQPSPDSTVARHEREPFLATLALFMLCYAGIGFSFYPHIVPSSVTIWDAAAPESSLMFLLVGASVLVPLILAYTAYAYWVFRGKVASGGGYH